MAEKIKTVCKKIWEYIKAHKRKAIFIAISLVLFILFAILKNFPDVAEYVFARGISRFLLFVISRITNLVPFSLAEWAYVLGIPLIGFFIVKCIVNLFKKRYQKAGKIAFSLLSVAIVAILSINVLFSFSYLRHSALPYLKLTEKEPTMSLALDSADFYIERAKILSEKFERDKKGSVISPYTFFELVDIINEEYEKLDKQYFSQFTVRNKPITFSLAMSKIGLAGIYFPFFAESNINVHMPDYSWGSTICHEMAHSKGVMRENEANFISYYLLITSDNEYLNYLGYMHASIIMLNETYDQNDTSFYTETYEKMSQKMLKEYQNVNEYWDEHEGLFEEIVNFFNDTYLKSQGIQSGIKSYSDTGRFLISLYLDLSLVRN